MQTCSALFVDPPGGLGSIVKGQAEVPEPGAGEITVRVHASSLNYHDYLVVAGKMRLRTRRIPMSDGAGEVVAVGPGVRDLKVGDAVVSTFFPAWLDGPAEVSSFSGTPGDGIDGYARELVTASATSFTRAPVGYSHAEAATLTTAGLTAWRALFVDGDVRPGSSVLVQGTGGVSIFALQFAKAAGARVIATSSSDAKLERLRALGADATINYRTTEAWGKAVVAANGGRGVDQVIDVGGAATLGESIAAARVGGLVSVVGVLGGFSATLPIPTFFSKQLRMSGLLVGSRRNQIEMIQGIEAGGIRPVIDRAFPLAGMADAFAYQEEQRHFGKIVLNV